MPRKERPEELELDAIFSASDTSSDEDNINSSVLIPPNQLSCNKLPGLPGLEINVPPPAQAPGPDANPPSLNRPSTSGYDPHSHNRSNTSGFFQNAIQPNILESNPVNQLSN